MRRSTNFGFIRTPHHVKCASPALSYLNQHCESGDCEIRGQKKSSRKMQIWFRVMKMRLAALSRQVITPFQGIWYRDVARHFSTESRGLSCASMPRFIAFYVHLKRTAADWCEYILARASAITSRAGLTSTPTFSQESAMCGRTFPARYVSAIPR